MHFVLFFSTENLSITTYISRQAYLFTLELLLRKVAIILNRSCITRSLLLDARSCVWFARRIDSPRKTPSLFFDTRQWENKRDMLSWWSHIDLGGTKISMKCMQGGYGDCWINVRWRMIPDEREKEREGEKITAGRAVTVARDIYPLSVNLFVHTWNSTPRWYASLPHLSLTYAKRVHCNVSLMSPRRAASNDPLLL